MNVIRIGKQKKQPRPYLTAVEKKDLKRRIETGAITIFRLGTCANKGCKSDVPKSVDFCSRECHEAVHGKDEPDATPDENQ